MSNVANEDQVTLAVPLPRVERTSQLIDTNATSSMQAVDIKIGRGVPSWSVAEYKWRYADTPDARRLCAVFADVTNSFICDHGNDHRDTNIGA